MSSSDARDDGSSAASATGRVMAGRFRLGRELGAGGMGTVHEAVDITLDRPVAIKVLRSGLAADETQVARFEREARAAARLAHPNVVGVTELVRDGQIGLGLAMELLVGESLHTRLDRGPLAVAEAKSIFMQALDGLAAAHAAGMVHRDLKPSNVFLIPIAGGVLVKLLDFGIVKLAEDGAMPKLTRKGALVGTPTYMSPEQVLCEPVDKRSDVYSIGACLYEALVARPPYDGPHSLALIAAVGAGPPPDLRDVDPDVSPDLAHIVRTAMSRDPVGRYQSAEAMREALRGASVEAPRRRKLERSSPGTPTMHVDADDGPMPALPLARGRWVVPAAIATVLAVAIGALVLRSEERPLVAVTRTDPPAPSAVVVPPLGIAAPDPVPAPPTHTVPVVAPPPPAHAVPVVAPPPAPPPPAVADLPVGIDPPAELDDVADDVPPERATPRRPRLPRPTTADPEDGAPARGIGEAVLDPFAH